MFTALVYGPCTRPRTVYTAVFTAPVHSRRRPAHGLYMAEAEGKAETDAKAEAKVIFTRTMLVTTWPRPRPQKRGRS